MIFYDEETEDEEEETEPEGEGQTQVTEAMTLSLGGGTDERPESVLTDVTIDGLAEPDMSDMPGNSLYFGITI